jgi:hypothetical protein
MLWRYLRFDAIFTLLPSLFHCPLYFVAIFASVSSLLQCHLYFDAIFASASSLLWRHIYFSVFFDLHHLYFCVIFDLMLSLLSVIFVLTPSVLQCHFYCIFTLMLYLLQRHLCFDTIFALMSSLPLCQLWFDAISLGRPTSRNHLKRIVTFWFAVNWHLNFSNSEIHIKILRSWSSGAKTTSTSGYFQDQGNSLKQ